MQPGISLEDAALLTSFVTEGGLGAAARSLGIPKSTASRRLRALEEQVGVALLTRDDGALRPTEAGVRFAERFAAVIDEAEEAHQSLADAAATPAGSLRIQAPARMGPQLVGELVASFLAKHAEVTAEIELVDGAAAEAVADRFDVVLKLDAGAPDPTLIARRLGGLEQVLCAAPGFLAAHGTPRRPEDLARSRSVAHGEALSAAAFALRVGGESTVALCPARMTVNQLTAVHRAVLAGLGIGALPLPLVHADLAQRRLVRVLPEAALDDLALCALVPSRRHLRPAVRALLDHIAAALRERTDPAAAGLV